MSQTVPVAKLRQMKKFQVERRVDALWEMVAPDSPASQRHKLTESFVSRGSSEEELDALREQVLSMRLEEKQRLSEMLSRGFQPEQVALFAQSTREERDLLSDSWLSGAPAHEKVSRVRQGAQTLAMLKFGGVATASLIVLAVGVALQSPDIVETSTWTTHLNAIASRESLKAIGTDAERMGLAGAVVAFSGLVYNATVMLVDEITREPVEGRLSHARRDLEDRVSGVFRRMDSSSLMVPGASIGESWTMKELEAIPSDYLPLLTHLHPKELVMFLGSEEEGRQDMMLKHRPGLDQRILTSRALASGRLREFSASLQQTLSAWEGGLKTKDAVTLDRTMMALREARQEKRKAGTLPPARPKFGPAAP